MEMFVNIDVPDLELGARFYVTAFGLRVGRRLADWGLELLGAGVPIYLLANGEGSSPFHGAVQVRQYDRHWTPVHLDFPVSNLSAALATAEAAGAQRESEVSEHAWGRMVLLSDHFGHGVCILELNAQGYDRPV